MEERIWLHRVAPRDCVSDTCGLLHDERVFAALQELIVYLYY